MRRARLGPASEVQILLPLSLVLVLALSVYSLFSFRNTLLLLAEERRTEAAMAARMLAARLSVPGIDVAEELQGLRREALGVAVVNASGEAVIAVGDLPSGDLFAPAAGTPPSAPVGFGFGDGPTGRVIGLAPLSSATTPLARAVRVDFSAGVLEGQLKSFEVVQLIVLVADGVVLLLSLLFLRQLLGPIEKLLSQARRVEPARSEEDEVSFLVRTFERAIEALKERETRLAENLAQLGEMAAGVAHELRNGLATIAGYLALAERKPEPAVLDDYLDEIRRESDQLRRVVDDFMAFARPGTARPEPIDWEALVRRAASNPSLAGAQVEIEATLELPTFMGDSLLLERALRNLIANALEAERRAGRDPASAEVRLRPQPDSIEITVEDRGAGLPDEVRQRLFQPFAAGHPGGVGLGLALAHRIVSLHGGQLQLLDRPGGGTQARLTFPVGAQS